MKNRFKIASGIPWKTAALMLFCTTLFFGCQKDFDPGSGEERQAIQLTFSVEDAFETGTQYVPMDGKTRAQSKIVRIPNVYQYYIVQPHTNGDYMIAATGTASFRKDKGDYDIVEIQSGQTYSNIVTSLRPGTYEIVLFTSAFFTLINPDLQVGFVLPGDTKNAGKNYAIKYNTPYSGNYVLPSEVFYARKKFTVSKTTDLHTPNAPEINIQLSRRVTKFRVLLQETNDGEFASGIPKFDVFAYMGTMNQGIIEFDLGQQNTGQGDFPWGLDIWGKVWYDPAPLSSENNKHTDLRFYASAHADQLHSDINGRNYYTPTNNSIYNGFYFFTDPDTDLKVRLSTEISVWYRLGFPRAVYYPGGTIHDFTLKNNEITGIVLKLTDKLRVPWPGEQDSYQLEPVYNGPNLLDPSTLFEGNMEFSANL